MKSAVAAKDLVISYADRIAIDLSTFSIPERSVTALLGPNGAGKSTLLNAIAGLVDPSSGHIEVRAREEGAHRIAYVLQSTKVNDALPVTVQEVVAMGRYATRGRFSRLTADDRAAVTEAMERTGIHDLSARHMSELSGGQRQRVLVAQGLAQDHAILLLDEPLSGIDLLTAQAIDAAIHDESSRGCTVILSTHDLSEAQVANHVVLLSGRVVASGPPADVLTAQHLTEAYGPALMHAQDRIFIDDAAHTPVAGRHTHRERSIHTEPPHIDTRHQ